MKLIDEVLRNAEDCSIGHEVRPTEIDDTVAVPPLHTRRWPPAWLIALPVGAVLAGSVAYVLNERPPATASQATAPAPSPDPASPVANTAPPAIPPATTAEIPPASTETEAPALPRNVQVLPGKRVNLRSGPGPEHPVLQVLSSHDALEVLDEADGYLNVRAADGTTGWISAAFATASPPLGPVAR